MEFSSNFALIPLFFQEFGQRPKGNNKGGFEGDFQATKGVPKRNKGFGGVSTIIFVTQNSELRTRNSELVTQN